MLPYILNFFSTRASQEKIKTGCLTQTQIFIYFYLITIFDSISLTLQSIALSGETLKFVDYINLWLTPAMAILGLVVLFLVNGGKKGSNFLNKYFMFSFTVGYKYFVAYLLLESLPHYIPMLEQSSYELSVNILMNIAMVINIGLRIYQAKAEK